MITHALPSHNFFAIVHAPSGLPYHKIVSKNENPIHEIKDPKSGKITKAKFVDVWLFLTDEFANMNAFSLSLFGKKSKTIADYMKTKFPELQVKNSKCEIWLMEKI